MDSSGWVIAAIVGAEVAFWALLLLGLAARYLLRMRRTSTALLVAVPCVDLVLVLLVAIDLARGAEPSSTHGLAAVYLGFSVGFGRSLVEAADVRFAHRFADGPPPAEPPRSGPGKVAYEWRLWLRVVAAWAVAVPLLLVMELVAGWSVPDTLEGLATDGLWSWTVRLTAIVAIWLAAGPIHAALLRRRPETGARGTS